jgi:hypothetical protein
MGQVEGSDGGVEGEWLSGFALPCIVWFKTFQNRWILATPFRIEIEGNNLPRRLELRRVSPKMDLGSRAL